MWWRKAAFVNVIIIQVTFFATWLAEMTKKSLANNRETDFKTVKDTEKTFIYFIYLWHRTPDTRLGLRSPLSK